LEFRNVDGSIILKLILQKCDANASTEIIWLRIKTNDGLCWDGDEHSGSKITRNFLINFGNVTVSERTMLRRTC
jgi:hypothetical protein